MGAGGRRRTSTGEATGEAVLNQRGSRDVLENQDREPVADPRPEIRADGTAERRRSWTKRMGVRCKRWWQGFVWLLTTCLTACPSRTTMLKTLGVLLAGGLLNY